MRADSSSNRISSVEKRFDCMTTMAGQYPKQWQLNPHSRAKVARSSSDQNEVSIIDYAHFEKSPQLIIVS